MIETQKVLKQKRGRKPLAKHDNVEVATKPKGRPQRKKRTYYNLNNTFEDHNIIQNVPIQE